MSHGAVPTENTPVSVDTNRFKLTNEEGSEGVLLGSRCRDCGIYTFGIVPFCQACTSGKVEPIELSQLGTLYSYTIVRVPPPGWAGRVPYILGQIELPEGPHVLAEVIDCLEPDLEIGIRIPVAPKGCPIASSPPSVLVGISPERAVRPSTVARQASPQGMSCRASNC